MLHFFNLWYKEVPLNNIYPSPINKIYGFLYGSISTNSAIYIIIRYKQINHKNKQRNKSQGGDIHRLLQKKDLRKMDNHLCD